MTDIDPNMSLDEAVPTESKYLAKHDVGEAGLNLKIASLSRVDMGDDGRKTVMGWTDSTVKPMVLNKTNKNRLAMILGAATVGELIGKTVNVFNDPLVEYGGKLTGGIRIRAEVVAGGGQMGREEALAKHGDKPEPDAGPAPTGPATFDDDIPF